VTTAEPVERVRTEVPGLDAVLRGGLVKGSVYVIQGPPGSGKTILANQIGYRHAASGGRVVYMTLMAETHARMMQSLRGMAFFDPRLVPSALQYVSGYKILIDEGEEGLSKSLFYRGMLDSTEKNDRGSRCGRRKIVSDTRKMGDVTRATSPMRNGGWFGPCSSATRR
jgi:hypothetical protein